MTDEQPDTSTRAPTCYRHPDRPALVRCSRCERPICADDLIEAPVGYQCPSCAQGAVPPRRLADLNATSTVTRALVVVIGVLFLVTTVVPGVTATFGLRPILVAPGGTALAETLFSDYTPSALARSIGEPWLLVTSALLHANLLHVGFNGLLLWQLGQLLEPTLGALRFGALCLAGLAGGAFGVVGLSWLTVATSTTSGPLGQILGGNPFQPTIGASGVVFGLMGAAMVGLRTRGVNPWRTGIGTLVALNLVITFVLPGISVGGHVGGLLGGVAAGKVLFTDRERARRATVLVALGALALLGASVAAAELLVRALV